MDNNVIISSRGKSSTSQSLTVGLILLIIGFIILAVFSSSLDKVDLLKMADYDKDVADIMELLIYAFPGLIILSGVIAIISGLAFKKVYIDIYKDYVQGTFINSKAQLEESITIMISDIVTVTGASGALKITTIGGVTYQITVNNALKKEIVNHLNRVMMERRRGAQ